MTRSAALPAAFFLILLLLATGCGQSSAGPSAASPDSAGIADAVARFERASCPGPPLKVAVMQDKSASANEYRTPQLAVSDLAPIIERLRACGGELAVGLIKTESNRSLTRLYVPRPDLPPRPEKPTREEGENVFAYDQAMMKYRKKRAKANKARKAAKARHRRTVKKRVETFTSTAAELLDTAPEAQYTDVWGGIRRAELFLDEPDVSYDATPRKVLIIVSDARDNRNRPPVEAPLPSGAQVLLVNGAPSLGSLSALKPTRFESISGAVRHLERSFGR